ncbi:MAG: hypothetical protein HY298_17540 [Verrucomicrobia bacterium]|nr:hypothetical protein [Verrucomicrobiota bacterium]
MVISYDFFKNSMSVTDGASVASRMLKLNLRTVTEISAKTLKAGKKQAPFITLRTIMCLLAFAWIIQGSWQAAASEGLQYPSDDEHCTSCEAVWVANLAGGLHALRR